MHLFSVAVMQTGKNKKFKKMKINKMKLNQYYKNYKKHTDCCVFSEFSTKTQRRNTKQQLTFIQET